MQQPDDASVFGGEHGEMARLVRQFGWAATPLGPSSRWPASMRALTAACLDSLFPMALWWGEHLIQIYNDAYRPLLGGRHPAALGKPAPDTWPEIWPVIGPMVEQVMGQGDSIRRDDLPLVIEGEHFPEERYFTLTYSPVHDELSRVIGMLIVAIETTERVRLEQRLAFILELSDRLRAQNDAQLVTKTVCSMLGRRLRVARVAYAEIDEVHDQFVRMADWTSVAQPETPLQGRLSDYGPPLVAALGDGHTLSIADVAEHRLTRSHLAAYSALHVRSLLLVPLIKGGQLIAVLSVSGSAPGPWSATDIALAEDVAERTWASVQRARAESALNIERDRSRDILESMDEAFVLVDVNFQVLQINGAALRMERRSAATVLGRSVWDAWPGLEHSELGQFYRKAMLSRQAAQREQCLLRAKGPPVWLEVRAHPYDDGLAVFYRDITETKQAEQRILEAAQHDVLTGLPNRALVFEYARHLLAASERSHGHGAILFIDLDRFKPINDLYGHEIGDKLLQVVGRRLQECVRNEDLVGRLGGDEFIVVLHQVGSSHSSSAVAEHILAALNKPFLIEALELQISACIGIAEFPTHGRDVDALIHAADLAMYQVKNAGRGNYFVYTPALIDKAEACSAIESRLKRALAGDGLRLHYQPVVDLGTGQVLSVEALLRIVDGESEVLPPERLIPIAEAAGLIAQLGEWVVAEACHQHQRWRQQGLPPVPVALNVSPLQFRQRGFAGQLRQQVRAAGIDPAFLQIDVTESTVMSNVEDAVRTLEGIRSSGIRVALDDFGTGYSSLSHLSHLPLDAIKVDQSFVQGLGDDNASRAITVAIIALGQTLHLDIVGEGIETLQALDYLREHGCNQAQGFYISPPLSGNDFLHWYRARYATEP